MQDGLVENNEDGELNKQRQAATKRINIILFVKLHLGIGQSLPICTIFFLKLSHERGKLRHAALRLISEMKPSGSGVVHLNRGFSPQLVIRDSTARVPKAAT